MLFSTLSPCSLFSPDWCCHLILVTFPQEQPTKISIIICSHGKALIASSSVSTTFSVLALLVLTLSSLKMSQLKLIPCFNSLANHTKSFYCFTFILFVKVVVQPFKSFHKTIPIAFPAYLLLSSRLPIFLSSSWCLLLPSQASCCTKPLPTVPPKRLSNRTNLQVFHRFEPFSWNQTCLCYFQVIL